MYLRLEIHEKRIGRDIVRGELILSTDVQLDSFRKAALG